MESRYREEESFLSEYPILQGSEAGKGAYGQVYQIPEKEIVVKTGLFNHLLTDVDVLSQISHVSIIPMKGFTIENKIIEGKDISRILFSMPRGESLKQYAKRIGLKNNLEELKRIFYHLLCALSTMHQIGILHADIKPDNIIMTNIEGVYVPQFIDFGITQFTNTLYYKENNTLYSTKGTVISYPIYTNTFRAPEVSSRTFITEKADIFALAKTLETLYSTDGTIRGYYPSNIPMKSTNKDLNDLLNRMMALEPSNRSSAAELLNHQFFNDLNAKCLMGSRYIPIVPIKLSIVVGADKNIKSNLLSDIFSWLIEICIAYGFSVKVLFLAIHNIHRTLSIAIVKNIQLYTLINLDFASDQYDRTGLELKDILIYGKATLEEYIALRSKLLAALGGIIICPTYWNMIMYGEDIIPTLLLTMKFTYNGPKEYQGIENGKYSKWQSSAILSGWHKRNAERFHRMIYLDPLEQYKDELLLLAKPITYIPKSPPIPLEQIVAQITILPESGRSDPANMAIGTVYHARFHMAENKDFANKILHTILNIEPNRRIWVQGFDIIFGRDKMTLWNKNIESLKINAYTASYEEIVSML